MAYLYQPRWSRGGVTYTCRVWWIRYRDADGLEQRVRAGKNLERAREILALIEQRVALERARAGEPAPRQRRDLGTRLEAAVDEWEARALARGRTRRYVAQTRRQMLRLLALAGWKDARDIDAPALERALGELGRGGASAGTRSQYLTAARTLVSHLVRAGKLDHDPLRAIERHRGEPLVRRRALSEEEIHALLRAAEEDGERGRMRALTYRVAFLTGLRRSEMEDLRWCDVLPLDQPPARIVLAPSATKGGKRSGREERVWVREDLRLELLAERARRLDEPQKARILRVPSVPEMHADLRRAGIDPVDAAGRRVDLHALRHSLATHLARAGVPQRVAQEIMRHRDPRLTAMIYTDASMLDQTSALERLPRVSGRWLAAAARRRAARDGRA